MNTDDLEQSTPYKLGQMDTRLTAVERDVTEIKADVKTLVAALNQQKGGKATVAGIGAGGVSIGALVVAVLQTWLGGDRTATAAPATPPVIIQPTPQQNQPPRQEWAPGVYVDPAPNYAPQADRRVNPAVQF